MSSASALRDLALQATEDPSILDTLTEDQIHELRREINPAGGVVSAGGQTFVNMSVINWSDEMRKNQIVMALIGYFSRMISEYEPEEEADAIRDKYREKISAATSNDERKRLTLEMEAEIKVIRDIHRKIARKVFDRNFEYDPDLHVRKAKSEGLSDKERKELRVKIQTQLQEDKLRAAEESLKKETSFDTLKRIVLRANAEISAAERACRAAAKVLIDPSQDRKDAVAIVLKHTATLTKLKESIGKVADPISAAECIDAVKYQPPADVFHHFSRYMANHYEFLNDLCGAYFNAKPDVEYMVTVYSAHDNEKEAQNFCKQHAREFRQEVFTVSSGGPTVLGSFKENRERTTFYTQDTEVLTRMMEQAEADAKLGKDLLEKRTHIKKKQNIRQVGPDRKGLSGYRAFEVGDGSDNVAAHGAKKIITNEKMKELEKEATAPPTVDLEKLAEIAEAVTGKPLEQSVKESADATMARTRSANARVARDGASTASTASAAPSHSSHSAASAASAAAEVPQLEDGEEVAGMDFGNFKGLGKDAVEALKRNAKMTQRYGMHNIEEIYKETPADGDEFEQRRRTGNYTVNDVGGDELPDDAVCSEVFAPVEDENGDVTLQRRMLYTAAEAPMHLQKDSPFHAAYQPPRQSGEAVGSNLVLRTVKDANGVTRDVYDKK